MNEWCVCISFCYDIYDIWQNNKLINTHAISTYAIRHTHALTSHIAHLTSHITHVNPWASTQIVPLFLVISLFKRSLARRADVIRLDWIGCECNFATHITMKLSSRNEFRLPCSSLARAFIWPYFFNRVYYISLPLSLTCFVPLRRDLKWEYNCFRDGFQKTNEAVCTTTCRLILQFYCVGD